MGFSKGLVFAVVVAAINECGVATEQRLFVSCAYVEVADGCSQHTACQRKPHHRRGRRRYKLRGRELCHVPAVNFVLSWGLERRTVFGEVATKLAAHCETRGGYCEHLRSPSPEA